MLVFGREINAYHISQELVLESTWCVQITFFLIDRSEKTTSRDFCLASVLSLFDVEYY